MKYIGPKHLFHILPLSPWPLLSSISAFFLVSGLAFYMHKVAFGGLFLIFGLLCLILCVFFWFSDIVDEATMSGYHTKAVRMGLRLGFLLFIVSEMMLFFGFFWAFFHAALCPSIEVGSVFPPEGIYTIPVFEFPLFNTFVLIFSGFSVTWAHRAVSLGWFKDAIDSLFLTVFLGFFFVGLQMFDITKRLLITQIVFMLVLFLCWLVYMAVMYCRSRFFGCMFGSFIKKTLYNNSLFRFCFCYLILAFCWCCLNFFIFNSLLLSSW